MRGSMPIASASTVTSAPVVSQISDTALMKEIFVARNALAETFTSSDVGRSVTIIGVPRSRIGAKHSRTASSARVEPSPRPRTMRSGSRVSFTAWPSRRNSGFHARSMVATGPAPSLELPASPASAARSARIASARSCRRCAVPTGTVDLPRITWSPVTRAASSSMTAST